MTSTTTPSWNPDGISLHHPSIHPRRVVITGMGAISSVGATMSATWEAVLDGASGIRAHDWDRAEYPSVLHGNVPEEFIGTRFLDRKEARNTSRFARMALESAGDALIDAGLIDDESFAPLIDLADGGVYLGTCVGGTYDDMIPAYAQFQEKGPRRVSPHLHVKYPLNMASYAIHGRFGFRGPSSTLMTACATGTQVVGQAFHDVKFGRTRVALAGAVESDFDPFFVAGFAAMKALCTDSNDQPEAASRPFDATRSGFVIGEGAAMFVLEDLEHALRRGATIYAEICGFASTNDAYHPIAPKPDGSSAATAMRRALADAGVTPDQVGHVNAHAASTPAGDVAEAAAIRSVFGERTATIPVTSIKGTFGHCMAASGSLETMVAVKSIATQQIPATRNYHTPDPEITLDIVHGEPRPAAFDYLSKNSFGLGGQNASLVIGRAPAHPRV